MDGFPGLEYLADISGDGAFRPAAFDVRPSPAQGEMKWLKDLYASVRYPAAARENGTQGTVVLVMSIDRTGMVTDVKIEQGLSPECDEAARHSCLAASEIGFLPGVINGLAVETRLRIPVKFSLQ